MAQEILLFRRDAIGRLAFAEFATTTLTLELVYCTLDLQEIYEDISFEPEHEEDEHEEKGGNDNEITVTTKDNSQ